MSAAAKTIALPTYGAGELSVDFSVQAIRARIRSDTDWAEHSHPTHELLWNELGSSTAVIGSRIWTITRNCGLWIPAGTPHSGQTPRGTDHRAVHFNIETFTASHSGLTRPASIPMGHLMRLLVERLEEPGLTREARVRTEAVVIDMLVPGENPLSVGLPTHPALKEMVRECLSHPERQISLAQWSERLNVSSRTITRILRDECGVGFSQWLSSLRINWAMQLLSEGHSVEEVSSQVGYGSATAFGTAFRRLVGMSPGRFRLTQR